MSMPSAGDQADVDAGAFPGDGDADVAVEEYRALLRAAERTLDGVDRALAALDEGTYGACELCGAAVGGRELELDPLATRCSSHRVAGGTNPSWSPRRSL